MTFKRGDRCGHEEFRPNICLICGDCKEHREVNCEPCIVAYRSGSGWSSYPHDSRWAERITEPMEAVVPPPTERQRAPGCTCGMLPRDDCPVDHMGRSKPDPDTDGVIDRAFDKMEVL